MAKTWQREMWREEAANTPPYVMSLENAWLCSHHNIPLEDDVTLPEGWVTNAVKYAYGGRKGEIRIRLKSRNDGRGELIVEDDGVGRGPQAVVKGTGLGTRIVATMASSMQAEVDYLVRQPGTAARLVFPLGPRSIAA